MPDIGPTYDVAVIGAGVFGAWTALTLRRRGLRVLLMDAYGPANSRASSGGESRIIRLGYGNDEIYTRWAAHSLPRWRELFAQTGEALFHRTGVLWLAREGDPYEDAAIVSVARSGAAVEKLSISDVRRRFSQFALEGVDWAFLEPDAGVLMSRRAVHTVVRQAISEGVEYRSDAALSPQPAGQLKGFRTQNGAPINAGVYIFACGAWLPKIFPALLADRFFISRQEVFFLGAPAGDSRFASPHFPTWIHRADGMYGMPDLEGRGVKIACDTHGAAMDPDTADRAPSNAAREKARQYVAARFSALRYAPILETRVCQYENTSSGDFLVDRHPEMENVWLVGGGSGHGFKHGPAMGEYVAAQIFGEQPPEPRFLLASKQSIQRRAIF
jgi:glycine/D-amino acid oxidase-like deaminating enzyme